MMVCLCCIVIQQYLLAVLLLLALGHSHELALGIGKFRGKACALHCQLIPAYILICFALAGRNLHAKI